MIAYRSPCFFTVDEVVTWGGEHFLKTCVASWCQVLLIPKDFLIVKFFLNEETAASSVAHRYTDLMHSGSFCFVA